MKFILKGIYSFFQLMSKLVYRLIIMPMKKSMFLKCGKNVLIERNGRFTAHNIEIGNHVFIGADAMILSSKAKVYIGDHTMFGPRVTVITGNHRTDIKGVFMDEISDKDKHPNDDQDIIFEGDNWVGANVTILKGVTIGKGAVVGAGSIVVKDVPPYSIVGGIPAKVLKMRFPNEKNTIYFK